MPIPDYQSLMLPVLRLCGDRTPHSLAEMRQRIATQLEMSEEDLAARQPSGEKVFANRIRWAAQFLKAAVVLDSVRRGVFQVTDRGLSLLKTKPSEITVTTLRQFPEFLGFQSRGTETEQAGDSESTKQRDEADPGRIAGAELSVAE